MIGYGDRARTQCEVVRLFRETHPDLPPLNQGTTSKIEAQYREMGHVRKVPSKRQAVVDDDTKLNLLLALEENPITPARQLARDTARVALPLKDPPPRLPFLPRPCAPPLICRAYISSAVKITKVVCITDDFAIKLRASPSECAEPGPGIPPWSLLSRKGN
ncbi:hypothetical protein NQ318_015736 [Aromia moschata]|uniref:DUF4817 domain-containing protein n=1 Tax=Aromia moschata TaxID=1265417 RepID=A0AAV8Y1L3_9CUCU|nr:hypothetical protein NQ318_015736 [Aromia moschata]